MEAGLCEDRSFGTGEHFPGVGNVEWVEGESDVLH